MMHKSLSSLFKASVGAAAIAGPVSARAQAVPGGAVLGSLAFAAPWALTGLAAVPVYWQMMRTVPPKPRDIDWPGLFLIRDLVDEKQKPVTIPLWQRLLRTAALTAAIIGFAGPEMNQDGGVPFAKDGAILLVINNGWAAADKWQDRVKVANTILDQAERDGRMVSILKTAPDTNDAESQTLARINPRDAKQYVSIMQPNPWPSDYGMALKMLSSIEGKIGNVFWLSAGIDNPDLMPFVKKLSSLGQVTVFKDHEISAPHLLRLPSESKEKLEVLIERTESKIPSKISLTAWDDKNNARDRIDIEIPSGQSKVSASFDLPQEIRNSISMVTIDGDKSAGSVVFLDERWRRRSIGLPEAGNSVLDQGYYIQKALEDSNEVLSGSIDGLIEKQASVIILTDSARISDVERQKIDDWIVGGGTLLRFAGPNLAASDTSKDTLLPVDLYSGSRAPGASMTNQKKIKIAPFDPSSPFSDLAVPDDIVVERQVLARETSDLESKIWARLADQTPLVTARDHGKGRIVLVHTTANLEWSNLVYSADLFKGMLMTIIRQSKAQSVNAERSADLSPEKTLNAYGQLGSPQASARKLHLGPGAPQTISATNPPGIYGNNSLRHAHNLAVAIPELKPMPVMPDGASARPYEEKEQDWSLQGIILGLAALVLTLERLYTLKQQGALTRVRKPDLRP